MSPRGVRIPNIRDQLFDAADRVLERHGPAGLSNRAVTAEAGVSNGILHRHFTDLDHFLAEYIADRLGLIAETATALPAQAGHRTVTENLTNAALAIFGAKGQAVVSLVTARAAAGATAMPHTSGGASGLEHVESAFCRYLEAEKALGRISKDADTPILAFSFLGAIHHLVVSNTAGVPDLAECVGRIAAAMFHGMVRPS